MRNLIVFTAVFICSTMALADHHKGGYKGMEQSAKGLFKMADSDADGAISTAEHEQALAKMVERRRARFAEMDADGNGSVSKDEAQTAKKERKLEMKERRKKHMQDI